MRSICIIILNDKNDRNRMTMMITMTMMTVMLDTMMTMMMVVVGIVLPRPWLESEEAFAKRLHLTLKALLYICKWNNN